MASDDFRGSDQPAVGDRIDRQLGTDPPNDEPRSGIRRRPRPRGDTAAASSVQIALAVLIMFIVLLGLWIAWPLLSGGA